MARGDHLYYFRAGGSYSHHGLDCGDGTVIHYELTPWLKLTGRFSDDEPAKVARTSFAEFAQNNEVQIREYESDQRLSDVETTIARAEGRLGEEGYSIFGNNCEHFVVWCKTGIAGSSQVDAHKKATAAVMNGAPVGVFLLRSARRVPGPYRAVATLGAIGVAGAVYLGTYLRHRFENMEAGRS